VQDKEKVIIGDKGSVRMGKVIIAGIGTNC
jgi:hypothetical protein